MAGIASLPKSHIHEFAVQVEASVKTVELPATMVVKLAEKSALPVFTVM